MPRPDGGQQLRIGVLALQGDFAEHLAMLRANGVDAVEVRTMAQIDDVEGMVIPGGESTTIARLLIAFDMLEPLRARIRAGLPVWGTCAGAILLADNVPALDREPLGVMDMTVERNAFGRQIQSFEADIEVAGMDGPPLRAIFIRAPVISRVGPGVEVLATLPDGRIVAAREGRCLATSFHPELTTDTRMHGLFVEMCRETVLARQAS
ncbi:MAG: pyridoxal 5'-phosphate synthase glutaminase subunit PdxT [Chloroflexi bacterium]|nr:pyridoxal 5'-phosphate synthase glutaminase subunit PdxT [Chloroflexota bacterium]